MDFNLKEVFTAFMVLFAVIDIIGNIPIIIDLRKKFGHIQSEKASLIAGIIMIVFLFLGQSLLELIGIDVNSFAVAGAPIRIHAVSAGSTDAVIHHVVKVDAGASVTLIETGHYGARGNVVMEVEVADTGSFHHIRVQDGQERHMLTHIFARIGADATFSL